MVEEIGEAAGHGLVWPSEVRWIGDFFLDGDTMTALSASFVGPAFLALIGASN